MNLLEAVIAAKLGGGGGGGASVTPANVLTAIGGMSDAQAAAALAALGGISADQLGTVFSFKGSKATYADLLLVEDPQVGDVWFVDADSANYVWIEDEANPDGFWDEFGQPINLSAYVTKPTIVTDLTSTSITLDAADNTYYTYGTLTALTVSTFPASGTFWIVFLSGSTATTTTGISNFVAEKNKRYKITVENGYASYESWPTT